MTSPGRMKPAALAMLTALMLFVAACSGPETKGSSAKQPVSIAYVTHSFTGYSTFVAQEKGFFLEQGLDVELKEFQSSSAILKALTEGKADLGLTSETPFMRAILQGKKICAVASLITASGHLAVVGRRDKGIAVPSDLAGKRIGITKGSNGEFFLDLVFSLNNIPSASVDLVHLKPHEMTRALETGEVDAVTTWNPQMHQARKSLGENSVVFDAQDLYSPSFLLLGRSNFAETRQDTLQKVLRALDKATNLINHDKDATDRIVAGRFGVSPALLGEISANYIFDLGLRQPLLSILENEALWAYSSAPERAEGAEQPNFLNAIHTKALKAVKPENVTIIQ